MTTSLIAGMNYAQAVDAVGAEAAARMGSGAMGIYSEQGQKNVLIGVAQRAGPSFVLEVPNAEYTLAAALAITALMGFKPATKTAMERATESKK